MPLPHLDATLNQNHLYPLKLSICLGYCSFLHSVELHPRAGRVGANVWHEPRQGLWWSQLQLETWTIIEALPPEKSMLLHVWATFFPRSWALLYATATALSPMWSCIMINWEPDLVLGSSWGMCQDWCKKPGIMPGSFNLPSLPFCPPEQARECTLPVRGSPGFTYPFCQFHWSSKQPRGLLFPEPDSRAGTASVCLYLLTAWGGSLPV